MALEVGSRLSHYEVTVLIGEGGMGEVYRARDTKLDCDVVLKVPQAFTSDPGRLARFEPEAKVLASLNAPGKLFVLMLAILCVLGVALLAVGGQEAAAPTLAAADYDGRALVVRALERASWNEEQDFGTRYRSLMTREVRRFDGDGRVEEEDLGDYEVIPIDGASFERRLTINGRPLSEEEQEGERKREAEFREELRRRSEGTDDAEEEDDDDEIVFNEELIRRFVFTVEAEEPLRGRPSYRISFRPRHGRLPIRRRIDYALNKARGQVWIDQETFEAARVEFELIGKVRLWWGVVGTISHARGSLDRGPVLGDIWAQLQFETYTDIRAFLRRTRRAELRQWRDFGLIEE